MHYEITSMACVVPEVSPNTRILAILGADNPDPVNGDGWMVADYCLLNHMLREQGDEQIWLHAVDFEAARVAYGPILHGQSHRERRIVYDQNIPLAHLRRSPIGTLKAAFMQELSRMVAASKPDDRLLLILIGHGNTTPFGLGLGNDEDTQSNWVVTPDDMDEFLKRLDPAASQCIISTCCYAGGWICSNASRSSILAVATKNESDSFNESKSGNFRGGYFTAALCDTLRSHQASERTYWEPTGNVESSVEAMWELLLQVNPPVFSAQHNAWHDGVQDRTGLAQIEYAKRFETLPVVPGNPLEGETDRQTDSRRSRYLQRLVREYRAIKPGRPTASDNNTVMGRINRFEGRVAGPPITPQSQAWLGMALRHRLRQAFWAEELVQEMKLSPFPSFSSFSFDFWPYKKSWREGHYQDLSRVWGRFRPLLPESPEYRLQTYRPFAKPTHYVLSAALAKGLDKLEFYRRLAIIWAAVFPQSEVPSESD